MTLSFRLFFLVFINADSWAQFSPGDLSNSHRQFEGSGNCTNCHEVGKEISGAKCLACHPEIQILRDQKRGYHGVTATGSCVQCHKEHLGRESKTVLFEEKNFDHAGTGFGLSGKHSSVECGKCHFSRYRKDPALKQFLEKSKRTTYLGLTRACASCHPDPHKNKFGQECQSCHLPEGWKNVDRFDHARTKFPLAGKHLQVKCSKCHPSIDGNGKKEGIGLIRDDFSQCKSCHQSPHRSPVNQGDCSRCHSEAGWQVASGKSFDHDLTRYKLTGTHRRIKCEQCHPAAQGQDFRSRFHRDHDNCTDCHSDKHNGAFLRSYKNDCSACHLTDRFSPSTYSLKSHSSTRFPLDGAHNAVPCGECHTGKGSETFLFSFKDISCGSCHKDVHAGAFTPMMKGKSCEICHLTTGWREASFDHSTTGFRLDGRHRKVGCAKCHKDADIAHGKLPFRKISSDCQSCHADPHAGQFRDHDKTNCTGCHTAEGWNSLVFNHETQSRFKLTGRHKDVPCASCHVPENNVGPRLIRFKPLDISCESCHHKGIKQ